MKRVSCRELIELLERELPGHPGALVASDGDGTIWEGDIGEACFEAALDGELLRDEARGPLAEVARRLGLEVSDDDGAVAIGRELWRAQRAGRYPDAEAFAMMAWCFAGFREAELRGHSERVLDAFRFEERVRPEMREVLAWAARKALEVWLVSASPRAMVLAAARRLGLPAERVVAMTPAMEGGVVLPRLEGEPTYARGKVTRLRQRVGDRYLYAAFGDSGYDAALLSEAAIGVAVYPAPSLRHAAAGRFVELGGDAWPRS